MDQFGPKHLHHLISCDVDLVSGLAIKRKAPFVPVNGIELLGNLKENLTEGKLLEVQYTGMAFTLIKKEVFDKTVEYTEEGKRIWFTTDRRVRLTFKDEALKFIEEKWIQFGEHPLGEQALSKLLSEAINFGRTAHIGTSTLGEDICFLDKCREFGFVAHLDCGCPVGHIGPTSHTIFDFANELERKRNGEVVTPRLIMPDDS